MICVFFVCLCLLKVVNAILPPLTTLAFSRNGKRDGGSFLRERRQNEPEEM